MQCKYNCNHHHEIGADHQLIDLGDGPFVANNKAIPLLTALNEAGLRTRTHHIGKEDDAFVGILLDNAMVEVRQVSERDSGRTKYNGKYELLLSWDKRKEK